MRARDADPGRPPRRLSLRANFTWLASGRILYAASQWLVLVIIAKLGSIEAVGLYSLGLAICGPAVGFAMLGLRRVYTTDGPGPYQFGHYLALRTICGVLAMLAIGGIAWVATDAPDAAWIVAMVGLVAVIRMQSDMIHGLFQKQERMDHTARSLVLRGLLSPLMLAAGMLVGGSLAWGVGAQIGANLIALLAYDVPVGRARLSRAASAEASLEPLFDPTLLRRLAWQALPLGFVATLASLVHQVPRYFIVERLGVEALGYFAVMIYIVSAGNRLVTALGSSALARLARFYADARTRPFVVLLSKLAGVGLAVGLAGVLVAAVAGEAILRFMYAPEYARHADVFLIVMAAGVPLFLTTVLQVGVTAARRFRLQLLHYGVVVVVAAAAGHLWIGEHGLAGAAWSVFAAYTASLIGVLVMNAWSLRGLRGARPVEGVAT